MNKAEQEIIKLKEENKKLKEKVKQTLTELKQARDGVIDLAEMNAKAIVKEFKKSPKL